MKLLMLTGDRQVAIGEKGPLWTLQREFSRHFERIDVLCPPPSREVRVRTIFEHVHLHPAQCGRFGLRAWLVAKGEELVRAHGHAVITSHDYGSFYNGRAAARLSTRLDLPYLSEIHHVPGHPVAADARERVEKLLARLYVRWARSRAAAFRVVNATQMPALLRRWGVPEDKIRVLPSVYLDREVFRPASRALAAEFDVLFVGRLVANKGLARVVGALAELARRGRPARALFVGKGPLAAWLEREVRRRGLAERTRFVAWVDSPERLAEIYRTSRVCVCASTCEGGPRFTVEAMACGTPVVSTPVGIMEELVGDGRAGRLVGFDVASLADALDALLADEPARLAAGAEAERRARRFEHAAAIAAYAEGVKRLAREHRAGGGGG